MKFLITLGTLFLVITANSVFAQKTLEKATNEICDCMKTTKVSDNLSQDEYQTLINNCLANPLVTHYEKLCKELKIKNDGSQESYQELGAKIAAKLLENCPKFMELSMKVEEDKNKTPVSTGNSGVETGKTGTITGTIKSIDEKQFNTINIETSNGAKDSFVWLRYFTGSSAFENNPLAQIGKNVTISYREIKIYSPAKGDYVVYKEITEIKFND